MFSSLTARRLILSLSMVSLSACGSDRANGPAADVVERITLVSIVPAELKLRRGDAVVITSDNPAIASIDASGRVHAISPGVTTVRATADGVTGSARVEIADTPATHELARVGNDRLPHFVAGDSVMWNGERQYHEVFLEGGSFVLSGGAAPTYSIDLRYAEYVVTGPPGRRIYTLLMVTHQRDFGTVTPDARGDLRLTSSFISPLQHTVMATSEGMLLHFRIPGDDDFLDLRFVREDL